MIYGRDGDDAREANIRRWIRYGWVALAVNLGLMSWAVYGLVYDDNASVYLLGLAIESTVACLTIVWMHKLRGLL